MDVKENYISVKITLRKDGGSNIWKVQNGIKFAADNCTALLKISSNLMDGKGLKVSSNHVCSHVECHIL